jgi:TPR repeat protein
MFISLKKTDSWYILYLLLHTLSLVTYFISCYILYLLLHTLSPGTYFISCYILYLLLHTLSLVTYFISCYILYLLLHTLSLFTSAKSHLTKAVSSLVDASHLGYTKAQFNLGLCYEIGRGIRMNLQKVGIYLQFFSLL